jgi:hypothetical protein
MVLVLQLLYSTIKQITYLKGPLLTRALRREARLTSHGRKPFGHQLCPLNFGGRPLV